jgi:hypothetical protein
MTTLDGLSKAKQAVVGDAKKAGYEVIDRTGCLTIRRMSKHKKPRTLQGVVIYADGIAFDLTVDLGIAKSIRSAESIRAVLDLKA